MKARSAGASFLCLLAFLGMACERGMAQTNPNVPQGNKAARQPHGDVNREDRQEEAWKAWLQRHAKGPVYRVEMLFRDEATERLVLCQNLIGPAKPYFRGVPGLSVDERGKVLPPPNPGYERLLVQQQAERISRDRVNPPPLPFAEPTYHVGARLDTDGDGVPRVSTIRVSDLATQMALPTKKGEPQVTVFCSVVFCLELLNPEQAGNFPPLRQDAAYYKERTRALRAELLGRHRQVLTDSRSHLCGAAEVLREPFLLDAVRKELNAWIDTKSEERVGMPIDRALALARAGSKDDIGLFHRWVQRHPQEASALHHDAEILLKRFGSRDVLPLLRDLLDDGMPADRGETVALLLLADRTIPRPTYGDEMLSRLAWTHHLPLTDFGLLRAEKRLLELAPRLPPALAAKVTPRLKEMEKIVETPSGGSWLFVTEADRRQGVARMLRWLNDYRAQRAPAEE